MNNQNINDGIIDESKDVLLKEIAALKAKIATLEKANEYKSRFVAQISHEIRTPLNVVIGMASIGREEISHREKADECFSEIENSSRILLGIVDDIIDVSALSSGALQIENVKFDLKEQITNIAILFFEQAKNKNIHFDIHVKGVLDECVVGDEKRLTQILMNILNNAVKYTPAGGKVELTVVQASTSRDRVHMRFVIKDTGRGMSAAMLEDISSTSVDNVFSSTLHSENNLGLSIGKLLVEMMNGTIIAKSTIGEGTEITVDIPFARTQQRKEESIKGIANIRTLLICDDKAVACERGEMLADMGLDYEVASEYDEALDMIGDAEDSGNPYSLCMLNWESITIPAVQIIHEIRELFGNKIVIIATAYNVAKENKKGLMAGANYVIENALFRSTMFDALMKIEKGEEAKQRVDSLIISNFDFGNKRVLIAEDIALNMEVIVKLLSKVNISVACAENGMEAVEMFMNKPTGFFDCIFMDINMPGMDGYEATRKIRCSDKADAKTIPIYAMTANAFTTDIAEALDSGMDGHIAKPIDVNILYNTLDKAFGNSLDIERQLKMKTKLLEKQNEQLRIRAEHDALTGLLNRYSFEKKMYNLMYKNDRVAFIIIDVDYLKEINDMYGHEIGDKILVYIAELLYLKFGAKEYIARYSGGQFVVLASGEKYNAQAIKEIVSDINDRLKTGVNGFPKVSVSVGAAFSDNGYTNELYSGADIALREIKNNGKCGCSVYGSELT